MDMAGNEITVDLPYGQVHVILPEGTQLPLWGKTVEEEIQETVINACTHAPILHKLSGGCVVPDCECAMTRFNSECERAKN